MSEVPVTPDVQSPKDLPVDPRPKRSLALARLRRAWLIFSGLATLFGFAVAVVGIASSSAKELTLEFETRQRLMIDGVPRPGGLKVTIGDQLVESPWILTATFRNTGSIPIETRDIELPLTLRFKLAKVLAAATTLHKPELVAASVSNSSNSITLEHGLLNAGDSIGLLILLDGEVELPDARLRVSGVSEVRTVERSHESLETVSDTPFMHLPSWLRTVLLVVLLAIGAIMAFATVVPFLPSFDLERSDLRFLSKKAPDDWPSEVKDSFKRPIWTEFVDLTIPSAQALLIADDRVPHAGIIGAAGSERIRNMLTKRGVRILWNDDKSS